MAKKYFPKKEIRTEINCTSDERGDRIVSLILRAPEKLFELNDTLAASGALPPLEKQLERESKQIILDYLTTGEKWIRESILLRK